MNINIDTTKEIKQINNFWNNVHFHPTDAIEDDWGRFILDRISQDKAASYVRIYAMLEDIVGEDKNGSLTYDYSLTDKRIDYMIEKGFNLLICFNFMPVAIAEKKEQFSKRLRYKNKRINVSAPKDYKLWQEVCRNFTAHLVDRYGIKIVSKWYFHCWNEPDITSYWLCDSNIEYSVKRQVTEYEKLYDHFAKGVLSVTDKIKIGGPSAAEHYDFIEDFLIHTKSGTNYATGKTGTRLDFFSIHTYGITPDRLLSGESAAVNLTLDITNQLHELARKCGYENIEIISDEWGASSYGFYDTQKCPPMRYRNDEYFSAFFAKLIDVYTQNNIPITKLMICLSGQHDLTKDFVGYRKFFTLNGFPKPIYNAYALTAKLGDILMDYDGVSDENIGIFPTKTKDGSYKLMLYYMNENYNKKLENKKVTLALKGIKGKYSLRHYRIDHNTSNSYTKWCELGKPENPNQYEREQIKQSGRLSLLFPEEHINLDGIYNESIILSQNCVSLIELTRI